jgi:hypothetical protein
LKVLQSSRLTLSIAAAVLITAMSSCARKPLDVGVLFETAWAFAGESLTESERAQVRVETLDTLRRAFAGFDVRLDGQPSPGRLIRVEDTPLRGYTRGRAVFPGAVGETFAIATVSRVRIDALFYAELAVARCAALNGCASKTRAQLLKGLGRGIGATAAHELGHQAGLHFSRDPACEDCYDGNNAAAYVHFFGDKRWSADALASMQVLLPLKAARSPAL